MSSPIEYVAAAVAWSLYQKNPSTDTYPSSLDEFKNETHARFGEIFSDEQIEQAIDLLASLGFFIADEDPFAGRLFFITGNQFDSAYDAFIRENRTSVISKARLNGPDWLPRVFANSSFWDALQGDTDNEGRSSISDTKLVPASDRIVTLLHNSPEHEELSRGLENIETQLNTSNSLAESIGEDRERIVAEVKASRSLLFSDRVRVNALKEVVIRVLRELASKLKDKVADLGIDRLIVLLEKLIDAAF